MVMKRNGETINYWLVTRGIRVRWFNWYLLKCLIIFEIYLHNSFGVDIYPEMKKKQSKRIKQ